VVKKDDYTFSDTDSNNETEEQAELDKLSTWADTGEIPEYDHDFDDVDEL